MAVEAAGSVDVLGERAEAGHRRVVRRTRPQPICAGQNIVQQPRPFGGRTGGRGMALAGGNHKWRGRTSAAAQPGAAAAAVLQITVTAFECLPRLASAAAAS